MGQKHLQLYGFTFVSVLKSKKVKRTHIAEQWLYILLLFRANIKCGPLYLLYPYSSVWFLIAFLNGDNNNNTIADTDIYQILIIITYTTVKYSTNIEYLQWQLSVVKMEPSDFQKQ